MKTDTFSSKAVRMPKVVEGIWRVLWILFGFSFFTSKSGLAIFALLLVVFSLPFISFKKLGEQKFLVLFLLALPLGMVLNLFSVAGSVGSFELLKSWPWVLMILPGSVLLQKKENVAIFITAMAISLTVACFKSFWIFGTEYQGVFSAGTRVRSFYDIGRWGSFLAISGVVLFAFSYPGSVSKKYVQNTIRGILLLVVAALILSNTRGPWVGFVFGALMVTWAQRRYFGKIALALGVLLVVGFCFESTRERLASVVSVRLTDQGVTSNDASNAGRLGMWSVALDFAKVNPFFGTGFRNMEEPLRDFLKHQSPEYLQEYTAIEFSYNDAHSSYLTSLVEMGVFFFLYFWGVVLAFFVTAYRWARSAGGSLSVATVSALLANLVIFVFYSSYGTYESLLLFALPLMFYASREASSKSPAK